MKWKKRAKQTLAMALTLVMVVSLNVPVVAFGEETISGPSETQATEDISTFGNSPARTWQEAVTEQPDGFQSDDVSTVTISTPQGLAWFGKQINEGQSYAGFTITITTDLDMSSYDWFPIDAKDGQLANATIDGGDSSIRNLKIVDTLYTVEGGYEGYYAAFIGRTSGHPLAISNVTFSGANIAPNYYDGVPFSVANNASSCAVLVGMSYSPLTLEKVSVENSTIVAATKHGAYVGQNQANVTMTGCSVIGCTVQGEYNYASVIGYSNGKENNNGEKISIEAPGGITLVGNKLVFKEMSQDFDVFVGASGLVDYATPVYGLTGGKLYATGADFYTTDDGATTFLLDSVSYPVERCAVGFEASTGDVYYPSLQDAITAAASGQTITLQSDVTIASPTTIDKSLTIDLNGHKIINAVENDHAFNITAPNVTFTVNGTVENSGMTIPDTKTTSKGLIYVAESGSGSTVALNGGTYVGETTGNDKSGNSLLISTPVDKPMTVNQNLTDVTATSNKFIAYSDIKDGNGSLNIVVSGGSYSSTNGSTFGFGGLTQSSTVSFSGTGVTAASNNGYVVQLYGPVATFENCTFSNTGSSIDRAPTTTVAVAGGGSADIISGTYTSNHHGLYVYNSGGTLNVKGGTISGEEAAIKADALGSAVSVVNISAGTITGNLVPDEKSKFVITGGSFSVDPSKYVPEDYVATPQSGGTWVVAQREAATIAFDSNGGTSVTSITGKAGLTIDDRTLPADPSRSGYTFLGWVDAQGNKVGELPATFPAGATTYFATWEAVVQTDPGTSMHVQVTQVADEPDQPKPVVTEEAVQAAVSSAQSALETIKQGGTPKGMSADKAQEIRDAVNDMPADGTVKVIVSVSAEQRSDEHVTDTDKTSIGSVMTDDETVVYFDLNVSMTVQVLDHDGNTKASIDNVPLSVVDEPLLIEIRVDPELIKNKAVRIAHVHNGVTEIIQPESIDRENGIIRVYASAFSTYALLTSSNVTVTFESNGGSAVAAQSVPFGSVATRPADPTRSGYVFAGWYSDQKLTRAFDFATPLDTSITLYAKWSGQSGGSDASGLANTGDAVGQSVVSLVIAGVLAGAIALCAAITLSARRRKL